jgi:hypothetical protein
MTPTICGRCGGLKDRCECTELRREGMMMAADLCDRMEHDCVGLCAASIRDLARKPELIGLLSR